jgi:hypothetical protein
VTSPTRTYDEARRPAARRRAAEPAGPRRLGRPSRAVPGPLRTSDPFPKSASLGTPVQARRPEPACPVDPFGGEPPLLAAAAAAAPEGAAAIGTRRGRPVAPALAVLLAGHVLRDGEVVQLILKPSLWFVPFVAAKFAAAMAILGIAATLWLPDKVAWYYVEAAIFVAAGRLMWASLQWINRLYVLTDHRVLRLSGVLTIDIFDCPLRKVATTRVVYSVRERLLRLGSVEIQPADDQRPSGLWQTVAKPRHVHEVVAAAVAKAKSGGGMGG